MEVCSVKKKRNETMYFPSFKTSLKLGTIVFGTSLVVGAFIAAIDYGMSFVMSML